MRPPKMGRVGERLRAFLREIGRRLWALLDGVGPERVLAATIVILIILLLTLPLVAVYVGLLSLRQEAAEQQAARGEEASSAVRPEDIPLVFGPGPSGGPPPEATSPDGRRVGIPGLSDMDVIGELPHIPGTAFRCPGGGPVGDGRLSKRTCRSSRPNDPAVYEVTLVQDDPLTVVSVTATASDAPEGEAAEVLGRVAGLSLGATPMDAEAWVRRNISSGGQYFADGAEVRLYGTERSRTLEVIATAPPAVRVPEITVQGFEATQTTTPASR